MRSKSKSTKFRTTAAYPIMPGPCSPLLDQIREVQARLEAHIQTNTQQAEVLAEIRRQHHSGVCECSCDPETSKQALDAQADANEQLTENCKTNHRLIRGCASAIRYAETGAFLEAKRTDARLAELNPLYSCWTDKILPVHRSLR